MKAHEDAEWMELNYYGRPIVPVDQFDGVHYPAIVPTSAGSPPVCSCGWTRYAYPTVGGWVWVELYEHVRDMGEFGSLAHP